MRSIVCLCITTEGPSARNLYKAPPRSRSDFTAEWGLLCNEQGCRAFQTAAAAAGRPHQVQPPTATILFHPQPSVRWGTSIQYTHVTLLNTPALSHQLLGFQGENFNLDTP